MDELISELRSQEIILTEPEFVQYDNCQINHNDQGWFVDSYYQECKLHYVFISETPLSPTDIRSRILPYQPILKEFRIESSKVTGSDLDYRCSIALSSGYQPRPGMKYTDDIKITDS